MQVFSSQQWATMIVHSYPFFPSLETFLENIGARHNEPSLQQILAAAPAFPMRQEMIALGEYVRFVCMITCQYQEQPQAHYLALVN